MKPFKLGLLGYGKMGKAIINGLIANNFLSEVNLNIYTPHSAAQAVLDHPKVTICDDAQTMCDQSDLIFLAVKPQILMLELLKLREHLKNKVIISIAAGISMESLCDLVDPSTQVIRTMPNLAVEVLKGVILISGSHTLSPENLALSIDMFSHLGLVEVIDETKMDIGSVLIGSGPAFIAYFMDAMKKGSQSQFDDELTFQLLYQMVIGTITLLQTQELSPETLIENVCSPNGSTIEGINELRKTQVDVLINQALQKSEARAKVLGKLALVKR